MLSPEQIETLSASSAPKLQALRSAIDRCGSALIAFSGGVDSTLVLKIAADVLGSKAVALTALSESVSPEEAREAKELAATLGVRHEIVRSNELSNPSYAENSTHRCYFCKSELYELCEQTREKFGLAAILDGFNADDFRDHRPGHAAAREHRVVSPLAVVGLRKEEIRAWSFKLGLATWDKPQMACLASRIPYGTPVTTERLAQIASGESALRQLGLRAFRLRHHGPVARVEVSAEEYEKFHSAEFRQRASDALKGSGFAFVALDLEPFRSGRMNEAVGAFKPRSAESSAAGVPGRGRC